MKKTLFFTLLIFFMVSANSYSQVKGFYKKVDRILWVVDDINQVVKGWRNLGFTGFTNYGMVPLDTESGRINVYLSSGNLGGAPVTWIQPNSGNNVFVDFLKQHGNGAMALMHRAPNLNTLKEEIGRFEDLGVNVLLQGKVETDTGPVSFVIMDTEKKGKYYLGLLYGPDDLDKTSGLNSLDMKFNQYAFAIENPKPVSKYWESLGFPELEVTPGTSWGKEYYGQPADFEMNLGWQRHGNIVYEWCIPLKEPTVYQDHIKEHGEGIQHFGFGVKDMDEAIAFFEKNGYVISMSGGWGEKGKPGSGRFAYVDTESIGGETIELLWSYKE